MTEQRSPDEKANLGNGGVVKKISLAKNASVAVMQALVSGITLFLLYRYLLREIGAANVGIWAIVLATASASRISELGFAGSALKFTARYIARGESGKASEVIQTTVITIAVMMAGVLTAGYPLAIWLMPKFIPAANLSNARDILPYALVSVWIGALAGVFSSGLEGCQRVDLRAWISMVSGLLFLCFTWLLVPNFGLRGLAWAQIAQGGVMLIGSRAFLQRELPELPLFPTCWKWGLFREMFHYGANFQVTSIFAMLFEPTTKALMSKFGGLSLTAYYEMANRMVMQLRSLLIAANQVIVPRIATVHEREAGAITGLYVDSYRVVFALSIPIFSGIVAAAPLVSELWIGRSEPAFIRYSVLLAAAWWFNTINGPAYFVNLGTGRLLWNTVSHVIIGILNGLLGCWLGMLMGGDGVVIGFAASLASGSILIITAYHHENNIPLSELLPFESRKLVLVCCVGLLAEWFILNSSIGYGSNIAKAVFNLIIFGVIVTPVCWSHQIRARLAVKLLGTG